jgi:hypothetical protein
LRYLRKFIRNPILTPEFRSDMNREDLPLGTVTSGRPCLSKKIDRGIVEPGRVFGAKKEPP